MKDGVHIVYCDRPGCGKEVGAQRWEHGKVVDSEWIGEHCTLDETDDELHITSTRHFCSIECSNKADEFLTPEEIEDDDI